ncbi:MAG: AAA family ATPase [Syntrophaceae bacterium]|nr:AAA family ATPase [Syntrophaceae bacterium]
MYLDFYGLREKPFSLTPDPQFLYLSESHRTAIESLLYGIQQKEGFMVVTGDIGTGKTTICRTILGRLNKQVRTAVIFNSLLSEGKLLESILRDFGYPSKGRTKHDQINALNEFLLQLLSRGEKAVLIIDEAQNLSIPVLEQIRMLSNLETEKEKMLQIILFGQLELDQKLRSPKLKQLNQRISIRHCLMPLTQREMESYISQRLMVAGSQGSITFSKSALQEIYKLSKGTPRLINLLCDRALLGGFVEQTFHIDKAIIHKAKNSLQGEERPSLPIYFRPQPQKFIPLRIALWSLFIFLMMSLIILDRNYFSLLQNAKHFIWNGIPKTYTQIFGTPSPSASTIQIHEGRAQRMMNIISGKDLEKESQESSK